MESKPTQFPLNAAHLRLHKSLDLHLFDESGHLIGAVPLRDRLVTVTYGEDGAASCCYIVDEDREDKTQDYHVRIPMRLPQADSEYFDLGGKPGVVGSNEWFFNLGFEKDPDNLRKTSMVGIGVVTIADISIDPDPPAERRRSFWQRLRDLFFPRHQPVTPPSGLLGIPDGFPESNPLFMDLRLQFDLPSEKITDGAHHLRIGAFMGQVRAGASEEPYLLVCANSRLVGFEASPQVRMHG